MDVKKKAKKILKAVFGDLSSRGGIDNVLDEIREDKSTWNEMNSTLLEIIETELSKD